MSQCHTLHPLRYVSSKLHAGKTYARSPTSQLPHFAMEHSNFPKNEDCNMFGVDVLDHHDDNFGGLIKYIIGNACLKQRAIVEVEI